MPTSSLLRGFDRDIVLPGGLGDVMARASTWKMSRDQVGKKRFDVENPGGFCDDQYIYTLYIHVCFHVHISTYIHIIYTGTYCSVLPFSSGIRLSMRPLPGVLASPLQ